MFLAQFRSQRRRLLLPESHDRRDHAARLRKEYTRAGLTESDSETDPIAQFRRWFGEVLAADLHEPNAMILATSTPEGRPSARVVLLKGFDERGFPVAAVVDIDSGHRRGELLIGVLAADVASSLALKAAIAAMAFSFGPLRLDRLVSHVYGDNPGAQGNTVHLGFREEGRLRHHLRFNDQPIDLIVNGLLAQEHAESMPLRRLRDRWLPPQAAGAFHGQR